MKSLLFLVALAIGLAVAQGGSAPAKTGKLVGHVDVGPISPVQHPGHKDVVPPSVYKRYVILVSQPVKQNEHMRSHAIRMVSQLKLSDIGDFATDLAPGTYQLEVTSPGRTMMMPVRKEVTIVAGKTTKVTLTVDTGIR